MPVTEASLRDALFRDGVPESLHNGIALYVLQGVRPGDFLSALLQNDLAGAVLHADIQNLTLIRRHVLFVENELPAACHGSVDAFDRWLDRGGLQGHTDESQAG